MTPDRTSPQLFFIGIGPGDPELITLKAVRLIDSCDILFVPVRKKDSTRSIALNIVKQAMDLEGKRIVFLHFPMIKGAQKMLAELTPAVETIQKKLTDGKKGAFITLGCSTIYSTGGNLFLALEDASIKTHFIPGVSAINATAAVSGQPLIFSEEKLAILPATYSLGEIEHCLDHFHTVVLMKAHSYLKEIKTLLDRKGLLATSVIVEKASANKEAIHCLAEVPAEYSPHYMSTIIIRNNDIKE